MSSRKCPPGGLWSCQSVWVRIVGSAPVSTYVHLTLYCPADRFNKSDPRPGPHCGMGTGKLADWWLDPRLQSRMEQDLAAARFQRVDIVRPGRGDWSLRDRRRFSGSTAVAAACAVAGTPR